MAYEVEYLPRARETLDDIVGYLSQFYPNTPKKFLIGMDQIVHNLTENPNTYPVYSPKPGYHKAVVGKYIVFYTIDDENKRVEISRILRGSWDIKKYI
jgi:plasmid stabilization system protein ParE